jgi:ABC-type protease/lipase transport system fused ATPase/permease subunit
MSRAHTVSMPTFFKYFLVVLFIALIWMGWAYFSALSFLGALARGDRRAVEDHVDRASFQRSLEAQIPQHMRRDSPLVEALAGAIARIAGRMAADTVATYDLVNVAVPKGARVILLYPTAPTRMVVTVVNDQNEGQLLVFAFRDLGWYLIGVR